jgi:hypothetical protein
MLQAGITPIYEHGKIMVFSREPDELGQMRKEIERGLLQKSPQALRGKLALDSALERRIAENRCTL